MTNYRDFLLQNALIPLDKSWMIRMGVLDLLNGYDDISKFLETQKNLNDDLLVLKNISRTWPLESKINVGESGTLYRFLQFASWKLGLRKTFVLEGSLRNRNICNDPAIVSWSIKQLLILDNGTSQWASAAVLLGSTERIAHAPFKLALSYEALGHWNAQKNKGKHWAPRYDETILNQAVTFMKFMAAEQVEFEPQQSEDYCFARAFGFITKEAGEKQWPSLRGHESDRIKAMEQTIVELKDKKPVSSKDHRIVQAAAMYQRLHKMPINVKHPGAVNKSWPQFWVYMDSLDSFYNPI